MPQVPIIMPQLGESIAEATVINLLAKVGDQVNADQDIIEVETNKATMNVTSPCRGRVEKWLVKPNESYPVGAALGYLHASAEDEEELLKTFDAHQRDIRNAAERSYKRGRQGSYELTEKDI